MDKHFVPDLEDLYVGYKVELMTCNGYIVGVFPEIFEHNSELDEYEDSYIKAAHAILRTKYLDREDIESLGWIQHATMSEVFFREDNPLGILYLELRDNNIIRIENDRTSEYLFQGKAKSINELKKIMEWIL